MDGALSPTVFVLGLHAGKWMFMQKEKLVCLIFQESTWGRIQRSEDPANNPKIHKGGHPTQDGHHGKFRFQTKNTIHIWEQLVSSHMQ